MGQTNGWMMSNQQQPDYAPGSSYAEYQAAIRATDAEKRIAELERKVARLERLVLGMADRIGMTSQ